MSDVSFLEELRSTAWSVTLALLPLAILFMAFQIFMLNLPRGDVRRILTGSILAAAGLFLFLLGVGIGFIPFGRAIGQAIGGSGEAWLLLLSGVFLGFVTTWGEPAVRILADQVDDASNGSIRSSLVLYAICIGVSLFVGLGMLRIGYEISLLAILVPGYAVVLAAVWLSEKEFVSIAIDAGGVATGPLANSFLLALALGASSAMGGQNPVLHGLGLVALIALAPLISVMMLGLLIRIKVARPVRQRE